MTLSKETKWQKHRIGKIYGYTVFIELPDSLSGAEHNRAVDGASRHLERSFQHLEFLTSMKDTLNDLD